MYMSSFQCGWSCLYLRVFKLVYNFLLDTLPIPTTVLSNNVTYSMYFGPGNHVEVYFRSKCVSL